MTLLCEDCLPNYKEYERHPDTGIAAPCKNCGGYDKVHSFQGNPLHPLSAKDQVWYVDPECTQPFERKFHVISGFVAGKVYNDLCKMLQGLGKERWPDAYLQENAPIAHKFFMNLIQADNKE